MDIFGHKKRGTKILIPIEMKIGKTLDFVATIPEIIKSHGFNQQTLCDEIGISTRSFKRKIKDPNGFTVGEIRKIDVALRKRKILLQNKTGNAGEQPE